MCDGMFIQIYDRILCIIQNLCVIIIHILIESETMLLNHTVFPETRGVSTYCILHTVLYSTISLLYHNLPNNNPTPISYNIQIFSELVPPVTVLNVRKCLHASVSKDNFAQLSVKYLQFFQALCYSHLLSYHLYLSFTEQYLKK